MLNELTNTNLTDGSFGWLCKQRKHFPANSDVWHCRFHWERIKPKLKHDLSADCFTFQPLQKVTKPSGEVIHLWTSIDSLLLKQLSLMLQRHLPPSKLCTHLKWHGGSKRTITEIQPNLVGDLVSNSHKHIFVFRTGVKSYYESINHEILLDKLSVCIKDKTVMNLLSQYLKRSVESGWLFRDIKQGISSGCDITLLIKRL